MLRKLLLPATILLLFSNFALGQDFTIDAQLKPRFEHRNGFGQLRPSNSNLDRPTDFVSQRARLRFLFTDKSEKFKMGVSIQDVRTWGEVNHFANKDNGNLHVHEMYGELFFTEEFSAKVGRQELVYDDHRIFGSVDWAQQARSHDALVLKYEKNFKLHAGFAVATVGETNFYTPLVPGTNNSYKNMQYLWFNKKFEDFKLSALFMNLGLEQFDPTINNPARTDYETVYQQTLGAHGEWRPGKFGLNASVYYQFGKTGVAGAEKTIGAYNALLELLFKPSDKVGLILGAEILSGTAYDADAGDNNSFNPYFGTNHKFNGHMDYFYVGGRNPAGGLTDIYLGATYKVNDQWNFYGRLHQFMSAAKISDGTNEVDSNLGTEFDLIINHKFNKYITIQGGWSGMFATESMQYATTANAGGDHEKFNNWGWMGLVIKPTLFTTKK
ncbi:alginate export family protein [Flammeovirga sp. EKP202]|uniref:alginate export family protein n=1 Tax=Flammeovirga sp. EKP202 TaxID=2770592 RepID=UPI00165F0B58|nr:alginate export family protein [Flammeovirga sp. EKP202]MBD0401135.1 alginate export family protein [Flammeovirga sp. EKP202]